MKAFEIKALGLEEMNSNEIVSTNGGELATLILVGILAIAAAVLALTGHDYETDENGNGSAWDI